MKCYHTINKVKIPRKIPLSSEYHDFTERPIAHIGPLNWAALLTMMLCNATFDFDVKYLGCE